MDRDELDRLRGEPAKPRPKGTLPYLGDDLDADGLRDWLSMAFRPPSGWRVHSFERTGRNKADPCTLTITSGREHRTYRFDQQRELYQMPRVAVLAVSDGTLRMPHLTGTEVEDVWAALCRLGAVLSEYDVRHETGKWLEQLVTASTPLRGYTLVPDHRHDALMAIRGAGEFVKSDAMAMLRPGDNGDSAWRQRPLRFVDKQTDEQWVRAAEAITFVRYVVGAEPLAPSTFRARLAEVGVEAKRFEDYRPPHPKALLYRLTEEQTEHLSEKAEGEK
jgi:hypothetical protein